MARMADVEKWKTDQLESVFARFGFARDRLVDMDGKLAGSAPPGGWVAPSADAARAAHGGVAERLRRVVSGVTACRPVLAHAVDEIEVIKRELVAARTSAGAAGFTIGDDSTVSDTRTVMLLPEQVEQYRADRAQQMQALRTQLDALLARADAVDAALADILTRAAAGQIDDGASTDLASAADHVLGGAVVPDPPPAEAGPNAARAWWAGLSDTQREAMILRNPGMIGNRDGIPAAARDEANRAQLPDQIAKLDADLASAKARLADRIATEEPNQGPNGNDYSSDTIALKQQVQALQERHDAMTAIQSTISVPDRQLLLFDVGPPGGHAPNAAVAVGNVDTARHVAVFTPGLTTTVAGDLGDYTTGMQGVRDIATAQLKMAGKGDEGVATVAWLGYDAPQLDATFFESDRSVASADPAKAGGADLARFYDGIAASRPGDQPHVTALGHSYGSTTTGYALQQTNVPVDRAVFFGSPGLGTDDVRQLHVAPGHVEVIEARWDPVADLGQFGDDPNHLSGVTNLSSEATRLPDGTQLTASTGHGQYLAPGTTSQHNLGLAVAGLEDRQVVGPNVGFGDHLREGPSWGP